MRFSLVAIGLTFFALVFAGCSRQMPATSIDSGSTNGSSTDASPPAKVGETTKTGQIVELNNKLYLQVTGQPLLGIDSYNVDLKSSVGKTVTVTGEYSGDTLFVGKLE